MKNILKRFADAKMGPFKPILFFYGESFLFYSDHLYGLAYLEGVQLVLKGIPFFKFV